MIGDVIASQQRFTKQSFVEDRVSMKTLIEEAISFSKTFIKNDLIAINFTAEHQVEATIERYKVTQILVNLLKML